jgi:uncharacterized protein (TIGR02145 family)
MKEKADYLVFKSEDKPYVLYFGDVTKAGGQGKVFFGFRYLGISEEPQKIAIKIFSPAVLEEKGSLEEIDIKLKHLQGIDDFRHVVKILESKSLVGQYLEQDIPKGREDKSIFQNGKFYFIAMEWLEGETLAGLSKISEEARQNELSTLVPFILDGLKELHSKSFMHRDIKPDNILIINRASGGRSIKIIDIETCKVSQRQSGLRRPFISDNFLPPEASEGFQKILCPNGKFAPGPYDYFSLGCSVFWLLFSKSFVDQGFYFECLTKYSKAEKREKDSGSNEINQIFRKKIEQAFESNPEIEKGWMPFLEGMLQFKPADRVSSHQVALSLVPKYTNASPPPSFKKKKVYPEPPQWGDLMEHPLFYKKKKRKWTVVLLPVLVLSVLLSGSWLYFRPTPGPVVIDEIEWMPEDLKVTKTKDGKVVFTMKEVGDPLEENAVYRDSLGHIFYPIPLIIKMSQEICPDGFRLPERNDWVKTVSEGPDSAFSKLMPSLSSYLVFEDGQSEIFNYIPTYANYAYFSNDSIGRFSFLSGFKEVNFEAVGEQNIGVLIRCVKEDNGGSKIN